MTFRTFLWGSNQQRSAVLALEFIKVRTDLYFVLGSLEQAGENRAALGWRVDVVEEPASPARSVEQTVALDELRLTIHLKDEADATNEIERRRTGSFSIALKEALTVQDTRTEAAVSRTGSCSWTATSPSSL